MTTDNPHVGCPQRLGGSDIFLLLHLENLATDNAAHAHPVQHSKGHEHGDEVCPHLAHQVCTKATGAGIGLHGLTQHGGQEQNYKNLRHRIDYLHNPLHHNIHLAAKVAGNGAVQGTDHQHQQGGGHTHNHGDTGSNHHTNHGVATEFIGAEDVGENKFTCRLPLQLSTGIAKGPVFDSQLLAQIFLQGGTRKHLALCILILGLGASLSPDLGQLP